MKSGGDNNIVLRASLGLNGGDFRVKPDPKISGQSDARGFPLMLNFGANVQYWNSKFSAGVVFDGNWGKGSPFKVIPEQKELSDGYKYLLTLGGGVTGSVALKHPWPRIFVDFGLNWMKVRRVPLALDKAQDESGLGVFLRVGVAFDMGWFAVKAAFYMAHSLRHVMQDYKESAVWENTKGLPKTIILGFVLTVEGGGKIKF